MPLDYANLKADLAARGYTAPSDPQAVADALNALTVTTGNGRMVQRRTLIGELPPDPATGLPAMAQSVLTKFRGAARADPAEFGPYDTVQWLASEAATMIDATADGDGLQMTAGTLASIDVFGSPVMPIAYRFTAAEVAAVKWIGTATVGYVVATYGVTHLTADDIAAAWGAR